MEWKKIKIMLIVLFLFINVFLCYMLYNKNIKSYVETLETIQVVLETNNVTVIPNLNAFEKNEKMSKLFIRSQNEIKDNLLITLEEANKYEKIGKRKEIINLTTLLANFIRDIAPKSMIVKEITLGYFFNSNQVNEEVVAGEAEPCWIVDTSKGKYIYNAYTGELILKPTL